MRYLLVKNWRDHQHYKKRSPPWIKLHRAIIEDYAFSTLKDKTKAHLILIWVLASGTEGRVPYDAKFIASKISAAEPVDLEAIVTAGFLLVEGEEETEAPSAKSQGNGSLFVLPDWVIAEKWNAWVKIRPAKARTPEALAAAIEKLERFRAAGHDPNAIVANSLANGWQGLFAPDAKRGFSKPSLAEANAAAAAEATRRILERE